MCSFENIFQNSFQKVLTYEISDYLCFVNLTQHNQNLLKMESTKSQNPINQKMILWIAGRGDVVTKVCKTQLDAFLFERDMPAKYGVLFSKTPYMIKTYYL